MNFVYEKKHVAPLLYAVESGFESFFEVASVSRAGNERGKVERKHDFAPQRVGNVACHYSLSKSVYNRAFAHARLAYEHGIVFRPATKHLNDSFGFLAPPDDGIELAVARFLRQIRAEFRQVEIVFVFA